MIIADQKTPSLGDSVNFHMANAVITLHGRLTTTEHYCIELTHEIAMQQEQIIALSDRVTLLVAHLDRAGKQDA